MLGHHPLSTFPISESLSSGERSFSTHEIIFAQDYNDLVDQTNTIYGTGNGNTGYGGDSKNVISTATDLPQISVDVLVENEDWIELRNAYSDIAEHQGTTLSNQLPILTNLEDKDLVGFSVDAAPLFGSLNDPINLSEITTNRLIADAVNVTVSTKLSSTRSASWGVSPSVIYHEFTATFTDSDHARYFFNTGGEIRLSADRSGGTSSPQNTEWTNMLSTNSPITFNSVDYYNLTASFTTFYTIYASNTTTYNNPVSDEDEKNKWLIEAQRDDGAGANGGNGSIIRIKSTFVDGFFGPTQDALGVPGVPVGGLADSVDGIFISLISQKLSTEIFNIETPIFSTITTL